MTPTLREYDIGVMTIGAAISEAMIIPPHYNELTVRGHCTSDCFTLVSYKCKHGLLFLPEGDCLQVGFPGGGGPASSGVYIQGGLIPEGSAFMW